MPRAAGCKGLSHSVFHLSRPDVVLLRGHLEPPNWRLGWDRVPGWVDAHTGGRFRPGQSGPTPWVLQQNGGPLQDIARRAQRHASKVWGRAAAEGQNTTVDFMAHKPGELPHFQCVFTGEPKGKNTKSFLLQLLDSQRIVVAQRREVALSVSSCTSVQKREARPSSTMLKKREVKQRSKQTSKTPCKISGNQAKHELSVLQSKHVQLEQIIEIRRKHPENEDICSKRCPSAINKPRITRHKHQHVHTCSSTVFSIPASGTSTSHNCIVVFWRIRRRPT